MKINTENNITGLWCQKQVTSAGKIITPINQPCPRYLFQAPKSSYGIEKSEAQAELKQYSTHLYCVHSMFKLMGLFTDR